MTNLLMAFTVAFFFVGILGPNFSYYIKLFKPKYRVKTILAHNGIGNKYQAQVKRTLIQGWVTIGYDRIGDGRITSNGRSGELVFKLRAEDSILNGYDKYEDAKKTCLEYRDHLRVLDEPNVEYKEIDDDG